MNRDDIQKLLGGYATGTLTVEEQEALFAAALEDQELFDALAREQSLRDLLRDPAAKAHLLAALDEPRARWYQRFAFQWRPIAAGVAMAGVTTLAVVAYWQNIHKPAPMMITQATPPPAAPFQARGTPPANEVPAPVDTVDKRVTNAKALDKVAAPEESRRATVAQPLALEKAKDAAPAPASVKEESAPGAVGALGGGVGRGGRGGSLDGAPRTLSSGFRESDAPTAVGGYVPPLGMPVPPAPAAAAPKGAAAESAAVQAGQFSKQQQASAPPPPPRQQQVQGQQGAAPSAQQQLPIEPLRAEKALAPAAPVAEALADRSAQTQFYGTSADEATKPDNAKKKAADVVSAGRPGFVGNAVSARPRFAAAPSAKLGVRYSILRAKADGGFETVDLKNALPTEVLEVQLMPNHAGTLTVKARSGTGPWRELISRSVEAMQAYATPPLAAGEGELQVTLVTAANVALRDDKSPSSVMQQSTQEPATYVVTNLTAQQLQFSIRLR